MLADSAGRLSTTFVSYRGLVVQALDWLTSQHAGTPLATGPSLMPFTNVSVIVLYSGRTTPGGHSYATQQHLLTAPTKVQTKVSQAALLDKPRRPRAARPQAGGRFRHPASATRQATGGISAGRAGSPREEAFLRHGPQCRQPNVFLLESRSMLPCSEGFSMSGWRVSIACRFLATSDLSLAAFSPVADVGLVWVGSV